MKEHLKDVHIHIPYRLLLTEHLGKVVELGINPEISFNCVDLDTLSFPRLREIAKVLKDGGLKVTFHAPFMDLRPGAIDPKVRAVTKERLHQVFDLAVYFSPLTIVCHPSFDERYYVSNRDQWLTNSIETWSHFIKFAEEMGTVVALENVYETEPEPLSQLFQALPSKNLCFCFDTGHFNVFSRSSLDTWMEALSGRLGELHIHDNNGKADDHRPIGTGTFPIKRLFEMLTLRNTYPLYTLEIHAKEDLPTALKNFSNLIESMRGK